MPVEIDSGSCYRIAEAYRIGGISNIALLHSIRQLQEYRFSNEDN